VLLVVNSALHTGVRGNLNVQESLYRSKCALLSSTNADCLGSVGTLLYVMVSASLPKFLTLHPRCLLAGRYNEPPDNATGELNSARQLLHALHAGFCTNSRTLRTKWHV
jgi:hypothetical protein